jgi:general stress protein YciG
MAFIQGQPEALPDGLTGIGAALQAVQDRHGVESGEERSLAERRDTPTRGPFTMRALHDVCRREGDWVVEEAALVDEGAHRRRDQLEGSGYTQREKVVHVPAWKNGSSVLMKGARVRRLMTTNTNKSDRGFASMDPDKQRAIASKGGKAAHAQGRAHEFTPEEARLHGRKGGIAVSRDRKHMAEIGRIGGHARGRKDEENTSRTNG